MSILLTIQASCAAEMRDEIVADLRRREKMLRDSIKLQTTKATKAACYVAAEAFRVAASDYENMTIEG